MARRKHYLDDGDDSDSSSVSDDGDNDFNLNEDPDERAERELFEHPYGRKKRRKAAGRDDATYGVFGEDSEDEGFGGRKRSAEKRSDWTRAPAFVSSDKKVDISEKVDEEVSQAEEEVDAEDASMNGVDSGESPSASPPPSPRVRIDEDENEDMPPAFGLGSKRKETEVGPTAPSFASSGSGFGKGGIGANRGGIGSSKGGIGSSRPQATVNDDARSALPSSFGAPRPQRAFVRSGSGTSSPSGARASTPLPASEQVHFGKISGSFGARMLSKMGWQAGHGLGTEGQGIATPIEAKLRPKGMGIAFKGFKEKTEQSKVEARRRGEVVSDDEDEKLAKRDKRSGAKEGKAVREDVWRRPRKSKIKVEHKTYEEILAEAGGEPPPAAAGVGKIIDATGGELREVSSLADVSIASWTPSTDPMRLPEIRHNLRLITEACKVDLDGLAREAKALEERKKWIAAEDPRLRRKVEDEAELISRLQAVHLAMDDINSKAKEADTSDYEPSLEMFSAIVEKLTSEFPKEYERYRLDEVVIAAIVPTFRKMMASWRPLDDPNAYTSTFRKWRRALKMSVVDRETDLQVDLYGTRTVSSGPLQQDAPMTPYESLLWYIWLPKVRSAINNEWSPLYPAPAVKLYESWSDILPLFIKDNMLDQLILPKISATISNWSSRRSEVSLQAIVFPWLPHVGLRMEAFIDEARRKVRSMLRSWAPSEGVPKDFLPWKEVFIARDWEDMHLKYIVPKLGALLRDEFRINPRNQQLDHLKEVFAWSHILRQSILGQLLESEFFPKWLDVLHIWLIQPTANFEEIAQWYQFWKVTFPEDVRTIPAVEQGFTRGLRMINQALELDPEARSKLPKPDRARRSPGPDAKPAAPSKVQKDVGGAGLARPRPSRTQEITFREIVEEYVAAHNLLFMPAGKVHEKSRMPLFRVSKNVDGKGGLLVYLLDDAVWVPEGDDVRAITLEDMVLRATKGR